tara:strand:- start:482 stop:1186 length:705 start_codon:yes stop_codon:yes gene_type:complete
MIKEFELETYLKISPNEFGIYILDTKNQKNLFEEKIIFKNHSDKINLEHLNNFLEDNIFKIEKITGKFIKNISLIIESSQIQNLSLGIKKKNYDQIINKKFLESMIIESKDLFKENYQDIKIMHLIVNKYLINQSSSKFFKDGLAGDYFCIEVNFKFISNSFVLSMNDILEKFQIRIVGCLDGNYMKNFFKNDNIEVSEMAFKIQSGYNENEVKLVPKNQKNMGIFEKFFQLFS